MPDRGSGKSERWVLCIFLFLATSLNYMDRQALGVAAPAIQREFGLNNAQLGLLLSAFFYTYGIMQVGVGLILDRVNIRWGYALAVCGWSLAGVLTGLVQGIWQLFTCRLLLGLAEAANWPGAMRIISRAFPPEERSVANGIFTSGSSLGAIVTPLLMIWLSVRWGWRSAFIAIGLLGIIWTLSWLFWAPVAREGSNGEDLTSNPEATTRTGLKTTLGVDSLWSWREILSSRRFWGLVVASVFGNPCLYFYSNWLPTYLVQERGFSFGMKLGGTLTVPFLGLAVGYLMGGGAVIYLARRDISVASSRKAVMIGATGLMLLAMTVPWAKASASALILIFIATLSLAGWQANYLSFVEEVSDKHVAGVSGAIGSAGAFAGALFIWLAGSVSHIAHSFAPIFIALGIMPVIATFGATVIMGRITPAAGAKTAAS